MAIGAPRLAGRLMRRLNLVISAPLKRVKKRTLICVFLLVALSGLITREVLRNLEYLLILPYSQFTYPLEIDFDQLQRHYEANGVYPSHIRAINNASFPMLHSGEDLCTLPFRPGAKPQTLHLLILVKSTVGNRAFRDAIRASWVNRLSYSGRLVTRHAFVLGAGANPRQQSSVDAEQSMHRDIIQQGFVDAYFNNTYKTMFAFDWAAHYCPGAAFVLFADDDYYVSPPNLADLVRRLWHRRGESLALGHVFMNSLPKRSPLNRWYISLGEYPYAFWPPYPTGGAVLATQALCRRVSAVQRFVKFIRFDDVFLGIVMRKLGVQPEHHGLFYYELLMPLELNVYRYVIAMHMDRQLYILEQIWRAMNYTWHDVPVVSLARQHL